LSGVSGAGRGLALVDAGDLGLTTFRGQTGLNPQTTLVVVALAGDATIDGRVDAFDLNILASHWQMPGGAVWSDGDMTGDGRVDAFDLNILAANWQAGNALNLSAAIGYSSQINTSAIPEPASFTILAASVAALLAQRHRIKKKVEFHLHIH
jgi:hypothetical protein